MALRGLSDPSRKSESAVLVALGSFGGITRICFAISFRISAVRFTNPSIVMIRQWELQRNGQCDIRQRCAFTRASPRAQRAFICALKHVFLVNSRALHNNITILH
jgi:hypothetical protein